MEGWLLDCYPSREGGMTFWLKEEKGKVVKLRDSRWFGRIYASGAACDDASYTLSRIEKFGLVREIRRVEKRTDVFSEKKSSALEIELGDASNAKKTAEQFEKIFQNPDTFRLYNVDVLPEQQYFHQNELFPLARVKVSAENGEARRWELLDNVESLTYETPNLRGIKLDVQFEDRTPKLDSRFHSISLSSFTTEEHDSSPKPTVIIHGSEEAQMLVELSREVDRVDPDIIVTRNGDSFLLPYLYAKSRKHSVNLEKLNRDTAMEDAARRKISGTSYFQYGKILYSPSMQRLYGRLHLDEENTFVYDQCRLQGLYEVARLCRIPLQKAMRASIGKCLSGLQFYHAFKDDLLIPWKPDIVEDGKNGYELFTADRGGLVFNPLPGMHKEVGELDFASLYPSIIRNYNISAETVNCACCPDSPFRVEELKMRICWRRSGIVAKSLDLPIRKRFAYKKLRDTTSDAFLKNAYSERASALKWILVCCFGYLSYRNAKFGKIDSHMAVCALARKTLFETMRISEYRGFKMIHGIIDSLWLEKNGANVKEYNELCSEIYFATGFNIAVENIYKWIVFLPSKTYSENQVANRYFGCSKITNEVKVRGIESRRHDTPPYFKRCQLELLGKLAKCNDESELRDCARKSGVDIFEKYARGLEERDVPATELLIRRRLSKDIDNYRSSRQLSVIAGSKLQSEGRKLQAGQNVCYLITRYKTKSNNRALPEEFLSSNNVEYDSQRYVELLADCCSTILSPFGTTKRILLSRSKPFF